MRTRDGKRVPISFVFALLLLLAGVLWSCLPGSRFCLWLGAAGAAWFVLYGLSAWLSSSGLRRVLRGVLLGILAFGMVLFVWVQSLIWTAAPGDRNAQAQVGIIFGAGVDGDRPSLSLLARLEAGYDWWKEAPERMLIVTGGKGNGENDSEANVMNHWLQQRGVPAEKILVEDQARDTRENVFYSVPLLAQYARAGDPVAVISNEFHLYRCKVLVAGQGYQAVGIPAKTPYLYLKITYCLREFCSILLMWLGL